MSDQVSNEQLLDVLLEMKGDIGEIKATSIASAAAVERHAASISELQMSHSRLKGVAAALGIVGSVGGSLLGFLFHRGN